MSIDNPTTYKIIVLLFFLLAVTVLFSQSKQTLLFDNITKRDGLPSNNVSDIIKDNLGFVWVATNDGLCRYDGPNNLKIFKSDSLKNNNGLLSNQIKTLFWDSRNNLWIGTRLGGLTRYAQASNTWQTYSKEKGKKKSISHNDILCIYEDSKKRLWIGTENGLNLFDYETSTFTRHLGGASLSHQFRGKAVLSILEDNRGWLWIGTWAGGLHLLLEGGTKDESLKFRNFQLKKGKESASVWDFYQDHLGNYWIGTFGDGLMLMQLPEKISNQINQQSWQPQFHVYKQEKHQKHSLSNNFIHQILHDKQGNLWVATVDGLNRIENLTISPSNQGKSKPKIQFTNYFYNSSSTSSIVGNVVNSILEDDQGLIWFGTIYGISQFNRFANQFTVINLKEETGELQNAQSLLFDIEENIWLASDLKGLFKYKLKKNGQLISFTQQYPNILLGNKCTAIFTADGQELYVASHLGITRFNYKTLKNRKYPIPNWLKKSITQHLIIKVFVDREGMIWLGTDKGLFTIHPKTGEYKLYTKQTNKPTSISDNSINDIFQDSEGNVWIATWNGLNRVLNSQSKNIQFKRFVNEGGQQKHAIPNNQILTLNQMGHHLYLGTTKGLFSYNLSNRTFEKYPVPNNNASIMGIQTTKNQELWLSGNDGIVFFDSKTESFNHFTGEDGVGTGQFRIGASIKDQSGNIYFGSNEGLTYFHPSSIEKNNNPPPVYITEINTINPQYTTSEIGILKDQIHLNHDDYYLNFKVAALNYNRPEKNQYAFKLEGFDEQWQTFQQNTNITYTNLPPNQYQLKVKAANNDGIWNEKGASLTIIKSPAFWQTWWFLIIAPTMITGLILWIGLLNTGGIRRQNEILNKEINERKKIENELAYQEQFLRLVMDNVPQFICWVDNDARFLGGNKALKKILNLKEGKSYIGKKLEALPFDNEHLKESVMFIESVLVNGTPILNKLRKTSLNDSRSNIWIEQSFIPLFNQNGTSAGVLMCGSNITDRIKNQEMTKTYTTKLKEFNEELRRSNKELEQFAYIASHDLKEPLRIIGNFSGLLERANSGKLDQDSLQFLKFIQDGVKRMNNLMNSLLTYSKVGQKEIDCRPVDLNELLALKVFDLSQFIKDKNAKVYIEFLPNVIAEVDQLGLVFQNLISNAIKFNTKASPQVIVKAEKSFQPEFWKFSITDNGIGIAPKYHEQIFGIFRRLHNKSEFEGTGIGLSVCQKIVQRHGGKIWLKSELGKGTTFYFTISKALKSKAKKTSTSLTTNGV